MPVFYGFLTCLALECHFYLSSLGFWFSHSYSMFPQRFPCHLPLSLGRGLAQGNPLVLWFSVSLYTSPWLANPDLANRNNLRLKPSPPPNFKWPKKIRKGHSCYPLDPRSSRYQVAMSSKRSNVILSSSNFQVDTQRRVRRCPWKSLVSILVELTSVWMLKIPAS